MKKRRSEDFKAVTKAICANVCYLKFAIAFIVTFTQFYAFGQTAAAYPPAESSLEAPAETTSETPPKPLLDRMGDGVAAGSQAVIDKINETRLRRSTNKYSAMINYSPFDIILPSKFGLTAGMNQTADRTWEIEYLRGSVSIPFVIDALGSMTDERYSLIFRSYGERNSFNLSYGLTYFAFSAHLGSSYMNAVSNSTSSIDVLSAEAVGFNLALGNRWTFNKNITIGVDWLSWAQPVFITKKQNYYSSNTSNANNRDSVDKAMNLVSYFPRFAAVKVQLGLLF